MATTRHWSGNSRIALVPRIGAATPRPRPAVDERDLRIAAAERQVDAIVQQAAQQSREVIRELSFPLVHGTQLEGDDDS